jgi:hypothetical protein
MSFADRMRRWKLERASVHKKRRPRPRSNKFSGGDRETLPRPHKRQQIWVGGYVKQDGTKIKGYYRTNAQYRR